MIKVSDLLDLNKLGKMELVEVRPTYASILFRAIRIALF